MRALMCILKLVIPVLLTASVAWSQPPAKKKSDGQQTTPQSGREKNINFENSVVEGMNKNSLDSLEQVSAKDANANRRLYQKKPHFKVEMQRAGKDAAYEP